MENRDENKRKALEKLDELVKMELDYLRGTDSSINKFSLNIPKNYFTEDEKNEILNSIKQVQTNIIFYCQSRGIEIPELIKDVKTPNQI